MPSGVEIPFMDSSRLRWETSPNSLLGQGSFGIVYRGTWNNVPVAIKVIKPSKIEPSSEEERAAEGNAMKQHRREWHRLRAVQNPYIIQYLGVFRGANPKDFYIVTEYMVGGSLYDWLSSMRARDAILDNRSFLQVARHMAYGMCHVHSESYTHGDLKPQNVLLTEGFSFAETEDGHVLASLASSAKAKIADFGLSRRLEGADPVSLLESVTATADFGTGPCGTYLYMSPEAYKGAKHLTDDQAKAADVYAYGLIMFELLSGLQSWGVENIRNPVQLHTLVQEGHRPAWGERKVSIDTDYIQLVERCWSDDIAQRPTFDDINHELERFENKYKQAMNQGSVNVYPLKVLGLSASTTSSEEDTTREGIAIREEEALSIAEYPRLPHSNMFSSPSISTCEPSASRGDGPVITRVNTVTLTDSQTARSFERLPLDHPVAESNEISVNTDATVPCQETEPRAPLNLLGGNFEGNINGEREGGIDDSVLGGIPVLRVMSGIIEPPPKPQLQIEQCEQVTRGIRRRRESQYLNRSQVARNDTELLRSMARVEVEPQPGDRGNDHVIAVGRQRTPNPHSFNEGNEFRMGSTKSTDESHQSPAFQSQQMGLLQRNQDDRSIANNRVPGVEPSIPETTPQRLDTPSSEVMLSLQPASIELRSGIRTARARPSHALNGPDPFQGVCQSNGVASAANNLMPNLEHLSNSHYRQPGVVGFTQVAPPTVQKHLNAGMPVQMLSPANVTNSFPSHWQGPEHRAPNPLQVPRTVFTNFEPPSSETVDVDTVLSALRRANRRELLNSLWNNGQKKMVAVGLARANFLCGKEMLELVSDYLNQSKGLKQDELEPLVVRGLCTCIGNIAQNQCEDLAEDVVLKVVGVTLSTMFNLFKLFLHNISSVLAAFSACNFALCNLLRVHNKVRDPKLRSDIAEWISFSVFKITQGPGIEALSCTAISAARNFIWMNKDNLIAFLEKSRRSGVQPERRLLQLLNFYDWINSAPGVEASLSALAMTIAVLPAQQQEFVKCHGVERLLKVLDKRATNPKVARLVFAMLALLLSAPASSETHANCLWNDFHTDNGFRILVDAMNQMLQSSLPKEELVCALEAGCSALLMMARSCDRLRALVVDFDAPTLVVQVAHWLLACQETEVRGRKEARKRLCTAIRELVEELPRVSEAAQYLRGSGLTNALRGLSVEIGD